ncbi:MAG: family 43 glycosylhydrolase [Candidatus Pseudobacter hemicellulosilyticus]|uniref:Family 43 glycosylhydrolase n=1 Tax=Candidatus Pseudobacter hemicellulosilyticus TaxID=3121375 RepID=A0AAJ5WUC3_9BACT|nr:MAG: family 43 glycosylhydrolase [Pseudobacter sp.]
MRSLFSLLLLVSFSAAAQSLPQMYFSDSGVIARPIAKDPKLLYFKGQYLMYYSVPGRDNQQWSIGIAASQDLTNWKKVGVIQPAADYEKNGLCAPGAILKDGKVQLFYQTYGNGRKDAICHAWSEDGINFTRNPTNPIFHPTGNWTCGRAIDAEVVEFKNRYFLYFATRDTAFKVQMQGVAATASTRTSFNRDEWTQLVDSSILKPELPWEKQCIEAATCIQKGKYLYMFYAGGYNNEPQQIGLARSKDGIRWDRVTTAPFLPSGAPGEWNESESGHPDIFKAKDGKHYLFFQGNKDKGRSWYLSRIEVSYNGQWKIVP